jgi:hypothetical protein
MYNSVFKLQKFTLHIYHEINSANNVQKNYRYWEPSEKNYQILSLHEMACSLTLNQVKYDYHWPLWDSESTFLNNAVNMYNKLTIR